MLRRPSSFILVLLTITCAIFALCGCGKSNGIIGTSGSAALTSVSLTPVNPSISLSTSPAATQAFDAIGSYSFGNPQNITSQLTWASLDTTVATINNQGVATAVGSGRVIITGMILDPVSGKAFQVSTVLTVVPQLTAITISPGSAQIAQGTAQQFTATGGYNDGTSLDITALVGWNSSNPSAATVSSSPGTQGLVAAVGPGMTSISATLGAVSGSASSLTVSSASLSSLAVTPATSTVPLATSQQLVATGTFSDGTTQNLSGIVSWTTVNSPSLVARVSATGRVTGIGLGNETITATAPAALTGASASAGITVDESSVTGINVLPVGMVLFQSALSPEPVMANGTAQQMRAVATFNDGGTLDVTSIQGIGWSSTDTTVATVAPDTGLLTASGAGSTTVTAALGSQQGSAPLNVVDGTLQSLVLAPNNAQVALGGIQNVVAVASFLAPDNVTVFQQDVSNAAAWSGDAKASVSDVDGLEEFATGTKTGKSNLSASFTVPGASAVQASAQLIVSSAQLGTISLVPGGVGVPLDGAQQFQAIGNFTDGTQANLSLLSSWESSDTVIATVSPLGFAYASGPGQANIGVSALNSVTGSPVSSSAPMAVNPAALARIDICAATVANPLTNCPALDPVTPPAIVLANQTMFGLIAIGTFSNGTRQDLTGAVHWSSSNSAVATVSNDPGIPGITTGVGQKGVLAGGIDGGVALITATAGGISGSTSATVSDATPQSLAITPANGIVTLGNPQQCKVTASFSDGSKQDVTASVQWSSLNPDIAIVNPGGVAYSTGTGIANVFPGASSLVVGSESVTVTLVNPSTTSAFPWPVGSVIQLQNLTVTSGDVSLLENVPFTIVSESAISSTQNPQACASGETCTNITFAPPTLGPALGTYSVTAGNAQASALITATMNVIVNTVLTQVSGSTTLTVQ